jgi:hypothetical protein
VESTLRIEDSLCFGHIPITVIAAIRKHPVHHNWNCDSDASCISSHQALYLMQFHRFWRQTRIHITGSRQHQLRQGVLSTPK